ncbi:MAG: hypothetical protein ACTSR8_09535 [Promethearchaeota archaeon]
MDVLYKLYIKFILLDRLANLKEEDFIEHKDVMKQLREITNSVFPEEK